MVWAEHTVASMPPSRLMTSSYVENWRSLWVFAAWQVRQDFAITCVYINILLLPLSPRLGFVQPSTKASRCVAPCVTSLAYIVLIIQRMVSVGLVARTMSLFNFLKLFCCSALVHPGMSEKVKPATSNGRNWAPSFASAAEVKVGTPVSFVPCGKVPP